MAQESIDTKTSTKVRGRKIPKQPMVDVLPVKIIEPVYSFDTKTRTKLRAVRKPKIKTIVDILPMKIIERIAAQTDADTVFALMSVCKAFNTKSMQSIGEKYAKDVTKKALFGLIHCVRRFVTLFNDPVVSRNFISNVLRRMLADFSEATRAKKINKKDYRLLEFEAMIFHLVIELRVTIAQAIDIVKRLAGFQLDTKIQEAPAFHAGCPVSVSKPRYDPVLVSARDVIKKYFLGKQQKYDVTLKTCSPLRFNFTFAYEDKKLMIYLGIHYSTKDTREAKQSNNEHIRHIMKHIPSVKLHIPKDKKYRHEGSFEATPENIQGFANMMHETESRSFFKNSDNIVPYMDIYFMSAGFKSWSKHSFTRHVFSERIDSIHKVNRFLEKSWLTSTDTKDMYKPNYRLCTCGKCLK